MKESSVMGMLGGPPEGGEDIPPLRLGSDMAGMEVAPLRVGRVALTLSPPPPMATALGRGGGGGTTVMSPSPSPSSSSSSKDPLEAPLPLGGTEANTLAGGGGGD